MKKGNKRLLIGASLLVVPVITNHIIFKLHQKKPKSDLNEGYYNFKFGNIYYTVKGEGEPLLLIHGIGIGSSHKEWENSINSLATKYKVYALDLLGFGSSAKPAITYSSYLYVTLINSFIEDVIKEKTYVIASSNSAPFAAIACSFNSENFKKIILIAPTGLGNVKRVTSSSKLLCKLIESPLLGTSIYNIISSKYNCNKFLKNRGYYDPSYVTNHLVNDYNHMAHYGGINVKYAIASLMCGYLDANIEPHLEKITVPTHVIWGDENNINEVDNYNIISDLNPNINITIINNTKLLPHSEKPKEFYKICREFFLY